MYRVLIVDDNRLARQGIIAMMQWEQYGMVVVGEAENGKKALEFLKSARVDIVFVDLDMPVMDGFSFMEASQALYPNLLFVVLSFHENFNYAQTALRIGVIDYISKLQMENVDSSLVLKEISRKIATSKERDHKNNKTNGENIDLLDEVHELNALSYASSADEGWKKLIWKWNQMYWIYSDAIFEELCCETKKLNISVWKAAYVLLHLTRVAEKNIGVVDKPIKEYANLNDFFDWLSEFRDSLYEKADSESHLEKLEICIIKAIIYLKRNLGTKLYAEDLARSVNLSRSYFSIKFKKHTGTGFNEFLRLERIRAAQSLLVNNKDRITDIAQTVGYDDVNYFIRVFNELTGMTPAQYRKKKLYENSPVFTKHPFI